MKKTTKASPELSRALTSLLTPAEGATMKKEKPSPEAEAAARAEYNRKNAELDAIIRPLPRAVYEVDMEWRYFIDGFEEWAADYGVLEMNPDFQRGHVWTPDQQRHYIENIMRGVVTSGGMHIQFNCPNWDNDKYEGDLPRGLQCIDGLQRITAVREYLEGRVKPFGLSLDEIKGSRYAPVRGVYRFRVGIHAFEKKSELLAHYLALNAGGTPHSAEEIARVRAMQEAAAAGAVTRPSSPKLG